MNRIARSMILGGFLVTVSALAAAAQTCPTIRVNGPYDIIKQGTPVTFVALVDAPDNDAKRTFTWSVSAGTIVDGQGTSIAKVDTKGLGGQTVTVTVEVGGISNNCSNNSSFSVEIESPPEAKKVDEFGEVNSEGEMARLDNFAIELQTEPLAKGYVIVYSGPKSKPGDASKSLTRIAGYLTKNLGIDAARIVTIDGGKKSAVTTELWLVPEDAEPPTPKAGT